MVADDNYIFRDASEASELERLKTLEAIFDEKSRHWILAAGPLLGQRCLEVGAGAGSIAAWMSSQVGSTGAVMAVDTDTRFLGQLGPDVQVIEGALGTIAVPTEVFDLVHARYVLIHNAAADMVLDAMLQALKPGGALVLEEPDFSAAKTFAGPANLRQAFENVQRALQATFTARSLNCAFGSQLPGLIQKRALNLVSIEYDCLVRNGASDLARMMHLSTLALQDKYVETGCATPSDIAGYGDFAASPSSWCTYYATVRVLARKRLQ